MTTSTFAPGAGSPPEKPYSGPFVLRVPPELHRRLATEAADSGSSLNALVTEKLQRLSG